MQIEEVVVRPDICVAPGAYGTLQIGALVNELENTPPSKLEVTEAGRNYTLKFADVFPAHDILSTSTPEYFTGTLQSSSKQNWHSPFLTEAHHNSLPSSACSIQSSFKNPSTIRSWHTPVPAHYPQKTSEKKETVVDSGSTVNSMSLPEEEDESFVQIVKANKESVAQHWKRCPRFVCKFCNKPYIIQNKYETRVQLHLGVKPYGCQICKRRYLKKRTLNEHYSFHKGEKLYKCKICDSSYRHRENFKKHAESHEEINSTYLCELCAKSFKLQFDYWKHISSTHVIAESQTAQTELSSNI